jgi:hypothetical protein
MALPLNVRGQFDGARNITTLRTFAAAAQQDDDLLPAPYRIQAITGAVADTHFHDASCNRLHVTEMLIEGEAIDPLGDQRLRPPVAQAGQPGLNVSVFLTSNIVIVAYRLQTVKAR